MGNRYSHVTIEERCEIARLQAKGRSIRQIAASLDRPASTISRELKRNGTQSSGYKPRYADEQAQARRWSGSRLDRDDRLRDQVLSGLRAGWSPEQVAGRLALQSGRKVISHETIYRFIYAQLARTKDYSWRHYLPRAKSKRGWRGRKGGSPASFIALRRPLVERPQEAADRQTPGHWEADLMLFRTYGQAVLTLHERHSRLIIALRPPGKAADPIATAIAERPRPLPAAAAADDHLRQRHGVREASSAPCSGHPDLLLRHPFPPGRKAASRTPSAACGELCRGRQTWRTCRYHQFSLLLQAYNSTPRKCLGYYSPAEIISKQVLHLKCESTFRPSPE